MVMTYNQEQIDKIGYTIVYLSLEIQPIYKTKLLKLLYLLDETSIKETGIPFLNLEYDVWQFGPVDRNIFEDLSDSPKIFANFIQVVSEDNGKRIVPICDFKDDEFSDYEIELLERFVKEFKYSSSDDLVKLTHAKNGPWYNAAKKHRVLTALLEKRKTFTNHRVSIDEVITSNKRLQIIYTDYKELY
jgi:uncharacterized phage-associated protein